VLSRRGDTARSTLVIGDALSSQFRPSTSPPPRLDHPGSLAQLIFPAVPRVDETRRYQPPGPWGLGKEQTLRVASHNTGRGFTHKRQHSSSVDATFTFSFFFLSIVERISTSVHARAAAHRATQVLANISPTGAITSFLPRPPACRAARPMPIAASCRSRAPSHEPKRGSYPAAGWEEPEERG